MTAETGVKWVLRFIGVTTLPAFAAAVMPQRWLVFVLNWIEPGLWGLATSRRAGSSYIVSDQKAFTGGNWPGAKRRV